jgi:hypothetical protein
MTTQIPEMICWHDASVEVPDADTTVLVQSPDGSEPVWVGFYDELGWHHAEHPLSTITVAYWAHLPEGPIG